MREVTLQEFVEDGGKPSIAADLMGVTRAAVTQMLGSERNIRIVLDDRGAPTRAYEIKKFPKQTAA